MVRNYKFDNIKFFLIWLVVLGHFLNAYVPDSQIIKTITFFIYTFHMPAFIFLSGLFSNRTKQFNVNKFIVYIIFAISIIIVKFVMLRGELNFIGGDGWFLMVLALYMLITYVLREVSDFNFIFIFLILALFCGYDKNLSTLILRLLNFMPFYLMGLYMTPVKLENILTDKKVKLLSVVILILYIIISFCFINEIYPLRNLFLGKYTYYEAFSNCNMIWRILTYILSSIIMFSIFCIVPKKKNIISDLGTRTLQVYFYHIPIYYVLNKIGLFSKLINIFGFQLALIIYIFISLALTIILASKILYKPLKFFFKESKIQ